MSGINREQLHLGLRLEKNQRVQGMYVEAACALWIVKSSLNHEGEVTADC